MKNVLIISALAAGSMYGAVLVPGSGTWYGFDNPNTGITPGVGGVGAPGVVTTDAAGTTPVVAYWNNDSIDGTTGSCANIGCLLTRSGAFSSYVYPGGSTTPPLNGTTPAFLAGATGATPVDFAIEGLVSGPAEMIAEFSGTSDTNWIGWYDQAFFTGANIGTAFTAANSDAPGGTGHWGVIFTGSVANGDTRVFTPTAQFGLWLLNTPGGGVGTGAGYTPAANNAALATELNTNGLFTDTTRNGSAAEKSTTGTADAQHFALFAQSAAAGNSLPVDYFVGYEDLNVKAGAGQGDRDYQDGAFKLKVVPEPGYYVLLSLGLAGLGLRRRMTKKSVN